MKSHHIPHSTTSLLALSIADEADIVSARQRARQVAIRLVLSLQDLARLATAVSEIARNAFQYAGSGRVEFSIDLHSQPQVLWVEVSDKGPGIGDTDRVLGGSYESRTGMGIGLSGTRRLMDHFRIQSEAGTGTQITFGKVIPPSARPFLPSDIGALSAPLPHERASGALDELQR